MPVTEGSIEELTAIRKKIDELNAEAAECARLSKSINDLYPNVQMALINSGNSARLNRGQAPVKSREDQNLELSYVELEAQKEFVRLWHKELELTVRIGELEREALEKENNIKG